MEQQREKKKNKTLKLITLLLLLLLLLVLLVLFKKPVEFKSFNDKHMELVKPVIEEGSIERKSVEEIKQELQTQVDLSMINMSFNATPCCDETGFYNLMIESTNRNINNYIVEIQKADTGEVLWKSPMIKPNQHIKKVKLDVDLPYGETKCKLLYYGYKPQTNQYLGFSKWQITMYK